MARRVASPTSTVPGSAADWIRAAVLTRSPATIPSPTAPMFTAASPVRTPARAAQLRRAHLVAERRDRRDEIERRPHGPLGVVLGRDGVPQTAITASPMNFSTVPPYSPISRLQVSK